MTTTNQTPDRFLTVSQLIERWPLGRTVIHQLIKRLDFPKALVLLGDCHGQARSMGFLESDLFVFEQGHLLHASDLELLGEDDDLGCDLPAAKRAMPARKFRGCRPRDQRAPRVEILCAGIVA